MMTEQEMAAQVAKMEAAAVAAEKRAADSELSPMAKKLAEMRKREQDARETEAANARAARENLMALREMEAKATLGPSAIVLAVDLVALFPAGKAPPSDMMPNGGVVVVRDPPAAAAKQFHADFEAKKKSLAEMMIALTVASTVEPTDGIDGQNFASFMQAKPDAAIAIGNKVRELGGSRTEADKRGGG